MKGECRDDAEEENYTSFLTQLNVLFTQIDAFINSKDLNISSKTKLSDIHTAVEEWVTELAQVLGQQPLSISASQPVGPAPGNSNAVSLLADAKVDHQLRPNISRADFTTSISSTLTDLAQPPAISTDKSTDEMSILALKQSVKTVSDSIFKSKSLVDVVAFMRLLMNTGSSNNSKLRDLAKCMARLVSVRCCSIINAKLKHVLDQTYSSVHMNDRDKMNLPAGETIDCSIVVEAKKNPHAEILLPHSNSYVMDDSEEANNSKVFTQLANDIRISTKALKLCLKLVIQYADTSCPVYMRFVLQLCISAVKQIRASMLHFQNHLEKNEIQMLPPNLTRLMDMTKITKIDALEDRHCEQIDNAKETGTMEETIRIGVDTHAQDRVECLRRLWGAFLTQSISEINSVLPITVKFLVNASAIHELGAAVELSEIKLNAQSALFNLSGLMRPDTTKANKPSQEAANKDSDKDTHHSIEQTMESSITSNSAHQKHSVSYRVPPPDRSVSARKSVSHSVLVSLGIFFQIDYMAAIAQCCGEDNDGTLVATSIFNDTLHGLFAIKGTGGKNLLLLMLHKTKWRKALLRGIVNCIVSRRRVVLSTGLNILRLVATNQTTELVKDIGYIYSHCVFPLLESGNSPSHVRKCILSHLVSTFLAPTPDGLSMLLHLYRAYDLNVRAHQLDLVQKFVGILSRIVRQASCIDFLSDAATQQTQERPESQHNTSSIDTQLSIPCMALNALLVVLEALAQQMPPEINHNACAPPVLDVLEYRTEKVALQRLIEGFGKSRKVLDEYFGVSSEEINPPNTDPIFFKEYNHKLLPPPTLNTTEQKIESIVEFFQSIHALQPQAVADYLTTANVFSLQVCTAFMERLPLAGCDIVEALRILFAAVQLPKEGQRVERMLEYFSAAYFKANNTPLCDSSFFPFAEVDSCFLVAVASVMLNTSLHNPMVGSRMTKEQFSEQLIRCDELKNCTLAFFEDIFQTITEHPLNPVAMSNHLAQGNQQPKATRNGEPYGGLNTLFVSVEERRILSFELECHHLVSEIEYLLQFGCVDMYKPISLPTVGSSLQLGWCAVARDLYLSVWPSISTVFGPSIYEGKCTAEMSSKCIKGLQRLLHIAASFSLPMECEVALLALLRMSTYAAVREPCHNALLAVAATAHSRNFSFRSWYLIFNLLVELREISKGTVLAQVESVLARVESYTRRSCEEAQTNDAVEKSEVKGRGLGEGQSTTATETVVYDDPKRAAHQALEGAVRWLLDVPEGDYKQLSLGLVYLKRFLTYSVIIHSNHAADVVQRVNVHSFARFVMPHLIELVCRHVAASDCLQAILECAIDLLTTMWASNYARLCGIDTATEAPCEGKSGKVSEDIGMFDARSLVYQVDFVTCFDLFKLCFVGVRPSCMLVKVHLLQATKELISLTLRTTAVTHAAIEDISTGDDGSKRTKPLLDFSVVVATWSRVLYPLTRALCDRETSGTEVESLAGLVLRQLVAIQSETYSTLSPKALSPPRISCAIFSALLAHAAYIGCMCAELNCAQICVAQLNTICSDNLDAAVGVSKDNLSESPHRLSSPGESLPNLASSPLSESDPFLRSIVDSLSKGSDFVLLHSLERLSLVLRCVHEQIRSEAVEHLRTLSTRLQPFQIRVLSLQLSEVALECTLDSASPHPTISLTDPRLVSFCIFMMEVSPTMRQCARSAFRSTLPSVLSLLSKDLLAALPVENLNEVAQGIMEHCLVPMAVSSRVSSPHTRMAAAHSLTQCGLFCITRYHLQQQAQTAESIKTHMKPSGYLFSSLLNCVCLVLFCTRIDINSIVPADAEYIGKTWLPTRGSSLHGGVSELVDYGQKVEDALQVLAKADPVAITRNPRSASLCTATNHNLAKKLQTNHSGVNSSGIGLSGTPECSNLNPCTTTTEEVHDKDRLRETETEVNLPSHPPTLEVEPVTDRQLIEYCNLLVQMLSGLPKILSNASTDTLAQTPEVMLNEDTMLEERNPEKEGNERRGGWSPPLAPATVFIQLLIQSARNLFGSFWRLWHVEEMRLSYAPHVLKGPETAPDVFKTSTPLLPHTPLRGVLNSYVEMATLTEAYPLDELLRIAVDIFRSIPVIYKSSIFMQSPTHANHDVDPSIAAEWTLLQHMSPQQQQHVRVCSVGMYQELVIVVISWINKFVEVPEQLSVERREALRDICLDTRLVLSLVELLSPPFESLISTVKKYLVWYITQKQSPALVPLPTMPNESNRSTLSWEKPNTINTAETEGQVSP